MRPGVPVQVPAGAVGPRTETVRLPVSGRPLWVDRKDPEVLLETNGLACFGITGKGCLNLNESVKG